MKKILLPTLLISVALWLAVGASTGVYNPITRLSDMINDVGYITAESSTLADVLGRGNTMTNGTAFADGLLNGTNGVYYAVGGTNYWILLSE